MGNNYKWKKHDKRYSLTYAESFFEKPKNPRPPRSPTKKIKKTEDRYIVYPSPQTQPREEKRNGKRKKRKEKRELAWNSTAC